MERYLDLDLLVNGSMDALLLILTARLLNVPLRSKRILGGVLVGEIPVILSVYAPVSLAFEISKFFIPWIMVWVTYPLRGYRPYLKALLLFWILSAGLGGLVYALWGWISFDGFVGNSLRIGLKNLWILPLVAFFWWIGQRAWYKGLTSAAQLRSTLYDLRVDFGATTGPVAIKAMLDTGNQLRDPLAGTPVILVEEEVAAAGLPEELLPVLKASWQELEDPWPWLWNADPAWIRYFVFIPYQGVGHKSWLLGIRPQQVICSSSSEPREIKATIALVQQVLSTDGAYQALLHPEHVRGAEGNL
jgi:stage II sporulation protein GA (sporulation sigma-E factor processing peptidase)